MTLKRIAQQVVKTSQSEPQQIKKPSWRGTVSTGSLLLDKAISGAKTKYGGLPGGIIVEISGPAGSGKTTILAETIGSCQRAGGEVRIEDPEARLDSDYCKLMGVRFSTEIYSCPDTVTDIIESIVGPLEASAGKTKRAKDKAWRPDPSNINCKGVDSLAALSTRFELEQGDKMGQRRAKEFSEGLRIITRHIKEHNIILICSNQLRENVDAGMYAQKTISPGGMAIGFYSSVRIQLRVLGKIKKGDTIIGKNIEAFVSKNSLDIEWRSAPIRLVFGYGIDNLGANLQWLKDHGGFVHPTDPTKKAGYVVGEQNFVGLDAAIKYAEDNNLEKEIQEQTIRLWDKLELEERPKRKEKVR